MSIAPDSGEITPPSDPAPAEPARVLTPLVWSMLALSLVSIIAGVLLTLFLPKLWRKPSPDQPSAVAAPSYAQPSAAPASSSPGPLAPDLPQAPTPAQVSDLDGRLRNVEGFQNRLTQAAAAALAVSALGEAAQTSAPFADQLAALQRVLPASRDLYELRPLANVGAPSRAALAADFDDAAAKAIVAARAPDAKDGLAAKALYALSAVVVVRRVDSTVGSGPDAALARAGRMAAEGDLEGALAVIRRLPTKAQGALGDWRARAERRVEIDRRIGLLRQAALDDLARAQGLSG